MIFFFYGEDTFRSKEKLKEIKDKFLGSEQFGSGLSVFDFSDSGENNIVEALVSRGLFSEKRLVIVENMITLGKKEEQDLLLEYFKKNRNIFSDQNLEVVFREDGLPRKNNSFFKFLEKEKEINKQQFEILVGANLESWIVKKIKYIDSEKNISPKAIQKLIAYTGGNIFFLNNEIKKLVNFSDDPEINEIAVESLVRSILDSNIFATIDAVGENNKQKALELLENHLENGDDPFYLFSMLVYQFRNLIKVSGLQKIGVNNEYEIAKLAKMHPFVVKKSLSQIRNLPFLKLKKIYAKLSGLDQKIKTGKIDIKLALQKFLVEV